MQLESELKNVLVYVSELKKDDFAAFEYELNTNNIRVLRAGNDYEVKAKLHNLFAEDSFFISDDSECCQIADRAGIGCCVYDNGKSKGKEFSHVLYHIESLYDMRAYNIIRMYQRGRGIPWLIAETKRYYIREIREEDTRRLFEIYDDEDTVMYMEGLHATYEEELEYTRYTINNLYRFCEYGMWVVADKSTDKIIGRVGITDRASYDDKDIGFVIAKEYRRLGAAYEVTSGIIRYVKEELGIERLNCFVKRKNAASIGLIEKLGFKICRDNYPLPEFDEDVIRYQLSF